MTKNLLAMVAILALVSNYSIIAQQESQKEEEDTITLRITSKITIDRDADKELEKKFIEEAKVDGETLTRKWANVEGVEQVDTTVDQEATKKEEIRCEDCGGESEEAVVEEDEEKKTDEEVTKCGCGKKTRKCCSSCGSKCCSSCSKCTSCCK